VINSLKKILIIAAHQDDETIGCGGTIKKWANNGADRKVCFVTSGNTGIDQTKKYKSEDIVRIRNSEVEKAKKILNYSWCTLNYPTQCVKNDQEIFHKIIKLIRKEKPDLIITHSPIDKHRDHRVICDIVTEASWKSYEHIHTELGPPHRIKDLWGMEITDPLPKVDITVDITDTFKNKIDAMEAYISQEKIVDGIFDFLDGLAKVRGYGAGCKYGESFRRMNIGPITL